jgi:hypothetical protein
MGTFRSARGGWIPTGCWALPILVAVTNLRYGEGESCNIWLLQRDGGVIGVENKTGKDSFCKRRKDGGFLGICTFFWKGYIERDGVETSRYVRVR